LRFLTTGESFSFVTDAEGPLRRAPEIVDAKSVVSEHCLDGVAVSVRPAVRRARHDEINAVELSACPQQRNGLKRLER
jgi:pyridoxine 5'-phosphate synthase PdxJ